MAYKDGDVYYTKVVLVENGDTTVRRIQRLEWQEDDGLVHFLEGKNLPSDFFLRTGKGFKDAHVGRFLGVKTAPGKSLLPGIPTKTDLLYVIIGAALVVILKGVLTLAAAF